jgi:hypothetical protein
MQPAVCLNSVDVYEDARLKFMVRHRRASSHKSLWISIAAGKEINSIEPLIPYVGLDLRMGWFVHLYAIEIDRLIE